MPILHYRYVRSGGVYTLYGTLRVAGIDGYIWLALGFQDARYAYDLTFRASDVEAPYYHNRYTAFAVLFSLSCSLLIIQLCGFIKDFWAKLRMGKAT